MRSIFLVGLAGAAFLAAGASSTATSRPLNAQALRTCVDRWNQDNMLGWGPSWASVSVRRLDVREQEHVGVYDRVRRCTVSLAVFAPRDRRSGCSGGSVVPGHPKFCVYPQTTSVCVINGAGAYWCSRYADGDPPLKNRNATTNEHGVLKLDIPREGTHPTKPLLWQRRYPHVDGFIRPWTPTGKLRRGLRMSVDAGSHYRGTCWRGSEQTHDASALRCYSDVQFDPCFAPTRDWNRRGVVVACAGAGLTTFARFVITKRF